jgi:hypothetical protein
VLLLDDLHWADSGSIELLGSLLHRPPAAPVLIAVAVRPRQLPERLSAALARAGGLTRVELAALSPDDASALLGDAVGPAAAAALRRQRRQPVLPQAARPLAAPRAGLDRRRERLALRRRGAARGRDGAGRRARRAAR